MVSVEFTRNPVLDLAYRVPCSPRWCCRVGAAECLLNASGHTGRVDRKLDASNQPPEQSPSLRSNLVIGSKQDVAFVADMLKRTQAPEPALR